jgi:hypothetical protein
MKGAESLTNIIIVLIALIIVIFVVLYFTGSITGTGSQNIRVADLKQCCLECKSRENCWNSNDLTQINCYDSVNKTYVSMSDLAKMVGRTGTDVKTICGET